MNNLFNYLDEINKWKEDSRFGRALVASSSPEGEFSHNYILRLARRYRGCGSVIRGIVRYPLNELTFSEACPKEDWLRSWIYISPGLNKSQALGAVYTVIRQYLETLRRIESLIQFDDNQLPEIRLGDNHDLYLPIGLDEFTLVRLSDHNRNIYFALTNERPAHRSDQRIVIQAARLVYKLSCILPTIHKRDRREIEFIDSLGAYAIRGLDYIELLLSETTRLNAGICRHYLSDSVTDVVGTIDSIMLCICRNIISSMARIRSPYEQGRWYGMLDNSLEKGEYADEE